MKRIFKIIPLVFLCCFTVGCQRGEEVVGETAADVETDIQAIKEGYTELEAASNAADIDKYLSSIADDILFIPPNEPAYVGKEAFRSYFQQIFDKFTVQEKYIVEGVKVSGDLAVAHVTYSGIYTPKDGGDSIKTNGNGITVGKKQPDGAWKIIYMIWSNERLIYPEQAE
ncbi:MAG: SgcJ/EcaC family oxidoreductase [Acidobacteria bacterium]|nr:SgcJ/EcaC family oxidoreductase [Acidobacteriota bacterium]